MGTSDTPEARNLLNRIKRLHHLSFDVIGLVLGYVVQPDFSKMLLHLRENILYRHEVRRIGTVIDDRDAQFIETLAYNLAPMNVELVNE